MPDESIAPSQQRPLGEAARSLWSGFLKKWLDVRGYLKQRRAMLDEPSTITVHDKETQKNWASPLAFAIQGTAIVTLAVNLVAGGFELGTKKTVTEFQKQLELEIDVLELEEQLAEKRDALAKGSFPEADPWPEYKATFHAGFAYAQQKLTPFVLPFTLAFSAFFFRIFLGLGKGKTANHREDAGVLYLYLATGRMFWFNLVTSVIYVSYAGLFSALFEYLPFIGILGAAGIYVISGLVFFFWYNRVTRRIAIQLRDVFSLTPATRWWHVNTGENKVQNNIFCANILSVVCVVVALYAACGAFALLGCYFDSMRLAVP